MTANTRNESDMDNHLSRPEIADAIAQGEGRSVRRSETIGRETHYYALRLANGQILRLGEETAGIWSVYNEVLPALAVAGVLVVALAALLAAVFTRRLTLDRVLWPSILIPSRPTSPMKS